MRHAHTTAEKFAAVTAEFIREIRFTPAPYAGMVRVSWVDTLGTPRYTWRIAYSAECGGGLRGISVSASER
ncbi:MAG: hypothetical protein ACLFTT_10725 [Candidatus Hydrogenedentota bacterium]